MSDEAVRVCVREAFKWTHPLINKARAVARRASSSDSRLTCGSISSRQGNRAIRRAGRVGGRARRVPLWWDAQSLAHLTAWRAERLAQRAQAGDPFVCKESCAAFGRPLNRLDARARFIRLCRVLGTERQRELTIRHGRHSFVSHAPARGRSLAEVRDAAGRGRIAVTSLYMHVVADAGQPGDLFDFGAESLPAREPTLS